MTLKTAYQPLLPPGQHVMSMGDLHAICVGMFPASAGRPILFAELQRLVADLQALHLTCELWIDGSFLTEKQEPSDIDLSFTSWAYDLDMIDPVLSNALLDHLNGGKKYSPALDTYVGIRFHKDDPRKPADNTLYWAEKWGIGWDDYLKGYAIIKLGENDVGLRLCS